jgi:xanthine dehydrogenase large subunit
LAKFWAEGVVTHAVHESALLHATGEARYVHDLALRDPTCVARVAVQSPHAHALVRSLDTALRCVARRAHRAHGGRRPRREADRSRCATTRPLFPSEVCYHGQPVCWVIADTEAEARAAAAQVAVVYEPLPALLTIEDAIAADSFLTQTQAIETGSPTKRWSRARIGLYGELRVGGQEHFYLEMQCAYVHRDAASGFHVHSSTQHPTETQLTVAHVLGVPAHEVICECVAHGRRVRRQGDAGEHLRGDRSTRLPRHGARRSSCASTARRDITITGKRHPFLARYEVGFEGERQVCARCASSLFSNGGYSLDLSAAIMNRALFPHRQLLSHRAPARARARRAHAPAVEHRRCAGSAGRRRWSSSRRSSTASRGTLALPAEHVRERNFYRTRPIIRTTGRQVRDAERIERIWRELLQSSNFAARRRELGGNETHAQRHEARSRDHAREVRHLVHDDVSEPGRRRRCSSTATAACR